MYDKFVGFVEDLQGVGTHLDRARKAYGDAESKLATGRGNAVRQAELLRKMGVKPSKTLPARLVDASGAAEADDDEAQMLAAPTAA